MKSNEQTDDVLDLGPLDYGMPRPGYYTHERICDNCYVKFTKQIRRGVRIPKFLECTGCGCETIGQSLQEIKEI